VQDEIGKEEGKGCASTSDEKDQKSSNGRERAWKNAADSQYRAGNTKHRGRGKGNRGWARSGRSGGGVKQGKRHQA